MVVVSISSPIVLCMPCSIGNVLRCGAVLRDLARSIGSQVKGNTAVGCLRIDIVFVFLSFVIFDFEASFVSMFVFAIALSRLFFVSRHFARALRLGVCRVPSNEMLLLIKSFAPLTGQEGGFVQHKATINNKQ
jgi:hypothetical protein